MSLTKGLEQGTLLRMTQIIREELPGHPAAALTGPNIAREIMDGHAAASVIATEDLDVAAAIQRELQRGVLRLYTNHDVIGCELGGVFKNVVAIACGLGEGLAVGDNTRAAVMTRGLAEVTRLGVAMGGEPTTFAGLAGMGDLVATCISPHSRNRYVGEQLGRGVPLGRGARRDVDGRRRREGCGDRARAGGTSRRRDAGVHRDLRGGHRRRSRLPRRTAACDGRPGTSRIPAEPGRHPVSTWVQPVDHVGVVSGASSAAVSRPSGIANS